MKNERAPGEDGITKECIQLGGIKTLEAVRTLLNKCIQEGSIPKTWQNAQIILLYKKGDILNIENYRPISLLAHPYKLLTKIITNRLSNKLDSYQSPEQAGFRKGYSTTEQIQNLRTLIEKCTEYNVPIHLAFVDYAKAFDSIELWAIINAMYNARIDSRYRNLLRYIYENATIKVKIDDELETQKIPIQRGVRQGDPISPKLFTLALEDVFKQVNWENKGLNIDGRYLSHLRFADDIVIISNNLNELSDMLLELKVMSEKVGLTMNLNKTKVMTPEVTPVNIGNVTIENVKEYVYLGHLIKLGKENQNAEVKRRIRMTWAASGKLSSVIKNNDIPINLKSKVFNTCILPVLTYGMETMALTVKSANRLKITQRAIERTMLGIHLRDHIRNEEIRSKTKVKDVMERIATLKWSWVGHVARQDDTKWTKQILNWRPRRHKRGVGRPQRRWIDDVKEKLGKGWQQVAWDRSEWKRQGEAYVQEWTERS